MATEALDLWPPDIADKILSGPANVLRRQAAKLGEKTKNVLVGQVVTQSSPAPKFHHSLYIVAPVLSNYRYELLSVTHDLENYPASGYFDGQTMKLETEDDLTRWLKDVLASEKTRRVIGSLLGQMQT